MKRLIVGALVAGMVFAAAPVAAQAHTLSLSEAAKVVNSNDSHPWIVTRPSSRWCTRYTAHVVYCVVEHVDRPLIAEFKLKLIGNRIWWHGPIGVERVYS